MNSELDFTERLCEQQTGFYWEVIRTAKRILLGGYMNSELDFTGRLCEQQTGFYWEVI